MRAAWQQIPRVKRVDGIFGWRRTASVIITVLFTFHILLACNNVRVVPGVLRN